MTGLTDAHSRLECKQCPQVQRASMRKSSFTAASLVLPSAVDIQRLGKAVRKCNDVPLQSMDFIGGAHCRRKLQAGKV